MEWKVEGGQQNFERPEEGVPRNQSQAHDIALLSHLDAPDFVIARGSFERLLLRTLAELGMEAEDGDEQIRKTSTAAFSEIVEALGMSNRDDMDSESIAMPSMLPDSHRSAESKDFLKKHVLLSSMGSEAIVSGILQNEEGGNEEEEEENDTEEIDMDAYTMQVRGEIIDFFADAAERINGLIDAKEESGSKESEHDLQIEAVVVSNKREFETQIRPKVAEYLTLIQESIRALQAEEEELLQYCSKMYPSTCE